MTRDKAITMVPIALFVLLITVLAIGLHRGHQAAKFAQHVGDPAPATDLPILQGAGARFSTHAWRGRPYILNFFASWCVDCRAEHEELMTLSDSKMPLIGVIYKDSPEKATKYLERSGNPFLAVAQDDDGHASLDWGLTGIPETFVIDRQGVIRWHHIGALSDELVSDELMPVWEAVK